MRTAGWVIGCGLLLLVGFVLVAYCVMSYPSSPILPPHEVTDIHRAGTKSVWYFIVVPKTTSTRDLNKIAEYYASIDANMLVLNVHILCDRKYASYATGIESGISDREYYSHVLLDFMAGSGKRTGPVDQPGLGSACR